MTSASSPLGRSSSQARRTDASWGPTTVGDTIEATTDSRASATSSAATSSSVR